MATTIQQIALQDFLKLPNIEESPAWELVNGQVNQTGEFLHLSLLQLQYLFHR